jgi:hypothetical protein
MLGSTAMQRAALAVAFLAATSSAATAGTYVGLGIGTNAVGVSTEGTNRLVEDGRSARLFAGYRFRPMRFGAFAIEGALGGYGLGLLDRTSVVEIDAYQLSVGGRFNLPLGSHFEAFGRLGLQHTSAGAENPIYNTSGNGFLAGAGIAYLFNVGIGTGASVSIDYQLNKTELSGERFQGATAFDVTERQWTLGVAIGF